MHIIFWMNADRPGDLIHLRFAGFAFRCGCATGYARRRSVPIRFTLSRRGGGQGRRHNRYFGVAANASYVRPHMAQELPTVQF